MATEVIPTNNPHTNLLSALGSMSSLDNGVDIYDSDAYDTDLEDDKEKEDMKTYIGKHTYLESCSRLQVAPQNTVLKSLPEQELNLRGRNLGPLLTRPIIIALLKNTQVITLDMSDTGLGDQGAGYIAQMLFENEFICNLNIAQNSIGPHGIYPISEVLKYNNALIRLDLSSNKLEDVSADLIAATLKMNDRMEELNLSNNNISAGGTALGTSLMKNQSLETLNLSWNCLKGEGGVGFLKGVQSNTTLLHLDLSHSGLGYSGSLAIGNMLKKNYTLKYLDISDNNINWQSVLILLPGLKRNKKLEVLKMGNNPVTTTGSMDLIEALSENNSKVSTFSLKNVPVVGEFEMMVTAIRQTRPFDCDHGGIVPSHDMLGQRYERQVDPMAKIIAYMKGKQLRPAELFRSLDKAASNNMSNDAFVERLQKSGLDMPKYELKELMSHLSHGSGGSGSPTLDYKTMVKSVKSQVDKERTEAIQERERKRKIKEYHKKILSQTAIPENEEWQDGETVLLENRSLESRRTSLADVSVSLRATSGLSFRGLLDAKDSVRPNLTTPRSTVPQLPPINLTTIAGGGVINKALRDSPSLSGRAVMSMSGSLGDKVKEFGSHGVKQKRKKKSKSKKKRH